MKRLNLVFFDAGGGHRSAANALNTVIRQQDRPWEVRLVNLQDLLEPIDLFQKITGVRLEDIYNLLLRKGWTVASPQFLMAMHALIRLYHPKQVKLLRKFWREEQPDLVVSLVPNFGRSLFQSLKAERPATPLVTVLTDLADYPPHFWMEQQEQYFICGTDKAVQQARDLGHRNEFVLRSSGVIIGPKFYEEVSSDRLSIGLDPLLPTALVLFGGNGSRVMLDIVKRLQATEIDMQMIMLCGHNTALAAELRLIEGPIRLHIEGFTKEIPSFMKMADFMIGKPGPGSISEALAMKLPVIVERNSWTIPQERYNAEWIEEQGVGVVLKSFRDIAEGVKQVLEPLNYARYRAAAAAQKNRAVFEIPDMLAKILVA